MHVPNLRELPDRHGLQNRANASRNSHEGIRRQHEMVEMREESLDVQKPARQTG